jgi:hypothetical protein
VTALVRFLLARLLGNLFGDGFGADVAGRAVVYLGDSARESLRRDDIRLTTSRLEPGQTYTVIARPRANRRERKLAASQRSARDRYRKATRPSRRQLRAASRLARTQKKFERSRPGGRREQRLARKEWQRGLDFDRRMRPSRKEVRAARDLTETTSRLEAARAESFERARRAGKPSRRRARVRVYD